jgi:hypothetical protein
VTPERPLRPPPGERLRFLAETVLAEASLLKITDGRLFALPMDAQRAATLRLDVDLAERVDAFVARFGRLQDTVGDKLLPAMLAWLAEPVGPAIDNLARAERLGWIGSASDWLESRQLRNFMIHESVRDMALLASVLTRGHQAVPLLDASATAIAGEVLSASVAAHAEGASKGL